MEERLHKMVDGKKVYLTPEEEREIREEWARNDQLRAEQEKLAYQRERRQEYPPIEEQLDMMWHDKKDGTNVWFETIKAIKEKYPKPE